MKKFIEFDIPVYSEQTPCELDWYRVFSGSELPDHVDFQPIDFGFNLKNTSTGEVITCLMSSVLEDETEVPIRRDIMMIHNAHSYMRVVGRASLTLGKEEDWINRHLSNMIMFFRVG